MYHVSAQGVDERMMVVLVMMMMIMRMKQQYSLGQTEA